MSAGAKTGLVLAAVPFICLATLAVANRAAKKSAGFAGFING